MKERRIGGTVTGIAHSVRDSNKMIGRHTPIKLLQLMQSKHFSLKYSFIKDRVRFQYENIDLKKKTQRGYSNSQG